MSLRLATLLLNGLLLLLIYLFLGLVLRVIAGRTKRARSMPRVIVERGTRPRPGTGLVLGESATIGRSSESELIVNDSFASAEHARIFRRDHFYYVEDLGSTNGTFVDGQRISRPAPLASGTQIRIGETLLRYVE